MQNHGGRFWDRLFTSRIKGVKQNYSAFHCYLFHGVSLTASEYLEGCSSITEDIHILPSKAERLDVSGLMNDVKKGSST
ncbi:unnamed protein product [Urochloa humidicola]